MWLTVLKLNVNVINEYACINLSGNEDINDINSILSSKFYDIVDNGKITSFYLIIVNEKDLDIKQYLINYSDDSVKNIRTPHNKDFILLFHRNATIPYTWNLVYDELNEYVKLEDIFIIRCPIEENKKRREGVSNDRQNFYFKASKKGEQMLSFEYLPNNSHVIKTMIKKISILINVH